MMHLSGFLVSYFIANPNVYEIQESEHIPCIALGTLEARLACAHRLKSLLCFIITSFLRSNTSYEKKMLLGFLVSSGILICSYQQILKFYFTNKSACHGLKMEVSCIKYMSLF